MLTGHLPVHGRQCKTKCCAIINDQATANWFKMVFNMRTMDVSSDAAIGIDFRIRGYSVCQGTWQAFHGIPDSTMQTIVRLVTRGQTVWNSSISQQTANVRRSEHASLLCAAEQWWYIRLDYYELIVESRSNFSGAIQYPHNIDWRRSSVGVV